jgi:hypothetical protein
MIPSRESIRQMIVKAAGHDELSREAMLDLRVKFGWISERTDPIIHYFGTGSPGTLSYAIVSQYIEIMEEEVGLRQPPPPIGAFSQAFKEWKRNISSGFFGG